MFRCVPALLFLWTILASAAPAQAQWLTNFCENWHLTVRRNRAWPEPFVQPDREAVMAPFAIMTANGWRRQNLISDYHFDEDKQKLNQAGETKIRYILTQMPPNRRIIFVQRGLTPDVTTNRIDLVQNAANRMLPQGGLADVVESDLPNDGWPADDVDAVTRKFQATRPDPRLKSASNAGDITGSGASASGSR